ncbi:MAG: hypothetical protein R3B40_28965 [Polyangiales bacterium]|nr:hypothetical protein [Myxococcales bacterium]MCB9658620.1 hypothetical protein [Sandaracinaceae bacterium]
MSTSPASESFAQAGTHAHDAESTGATHERHAARERLAARVRTELDAPVLPEAHDVARYARELHGDTYGPALFYGSCLRADSPEGIMDVYLLSRSHAEFHGRSSGGRALAGLNWLIPPNIYFWMIPHAEHGSLRAKVAVVTEQQFADGSRFDAWSPSIWARFCQPCVLLDSPDEAARERVVDTIVTAILTAARWAAYLGPRSGSTRDYWTALFAATYGAELRPERNNRPAIIYDANAERYDALLRDAWAALDIPYTVDGEVLTPVVDAAAQAVAKRGFVARQRSGKGISVARIVKGALTFSGGVDYLLWKVERHSGVSVELSDWQRKHPFLGAPGVFLQLRRAGAVR